MGRQRCEGFTYLAVLCMAAVMGTALAAAGTVWSTLQQREKEKDLLFIGNEFRQAIGNYYESTPGTVKRYPVSLNELLKDNRQAATVRHLRRIYIDPMTQKAEWGIVRASDGGVMGIYSLSEKTPIKRQQFRSLDNFLRNANHYSEWRFTYEPISLRTGEIPQVQAPASNFVGQKSHNK